MSNQRLDARRVRVLLGGAVVAVSLAVAGVLGGVGLARSSVTAAQYQYGKIVICHHTHSKKNPMHTITISINAWKAHQKHGDTLGACVTTTTTTSTTTTTTSSHGNGGGGGHGNGGGNNGHGNGNGGGNGHGNGHK